MESTELIPMDGDVAKIQRRAEEFRDLPEALQRNLQVFLTLIMDILASAHQKAKSSLMTEATRQVVGALVRRTHDNLADVRSADPRFAAQEVAVAHDFRGHAEVSAVPGRVFVSSTVGRRDRPLKLKWFCSCSSLPPLAVVYFYLLTMSDPGIHMDEMHNQEGNTRAGTLIRGCLTVR